MLTFKTLLGAGWSVAARLVGRGIDFVTLLVLARGLGPADFGLIALAMALIVIVETVLEIPLVQALTRLRVLEKSHLDTAFTLGFIRGVVFSAVTVVLAWPFSKFYDDPRLVLVISVLAIGPIARGLVSPAMITFIKHLQFKEIFITQVVGKLIAAGLAVLILYLHGGYWAIVVNTVVASFAAAALSYVIAPYRPAFSLAHFREFSGFLGWFSLGQLVSALNWQFDRALLGRFLSKSDLGRYAVASDLAALPTQSLIGPAMQPLMAAFSNICDDDGRLGAAFLKASRLTMMLAMPASILMSLCADLIVDLLLGAKWTDASGYLRWLALTILLNAYFQPIYAVAVAKDRPQYIFQINLIDLVMRVILVPLGLIGLGVFGVIWARGTVAVFVFGASVGYTKKLVGLRVMAQFANLREVAMACMVLGAFGLLLRRVLAPLALPGGVELGAVLSLGGPAYAGVLLALGIRPAELAGLRSSRP